jgi:hypothetical protein
VRLLVESGRLFDGWVSMDNKQEPAQQVQQKRSGGSVNTGWIVIIIALAYASGYEFARSVVFSPGGIWSMAQVHIAGLGISAVLILVAFGLIGLVRKR